MVGLEKNNELILNTEKTNNDSNSINETILVDENNKTSENTILTEPNVLDINTNNIPEPNCLALTVRKDYNLIVVKNIFNASGRLSWKIVLSTIVLNFLNMIF